MITYVLTILLVAVFWNFPVQITCFNKSFVLPVSLIVLIYVSSIYLIFKSNLYFKGLLNSFFDKTHKTEQAKEKCVKAVLEYIAGDKQMAEKLWHEAYDYLSQDKLFILLSAINSAFQNQEELKISSQENLKQIEAKLDIPGKAIIRDYFLYLINKSKVNGSASNVNVYSNAQLSEIIKEYKSPWAFKALINNYLLDKDFISAQATLKQFAKSGLLNVFEWRALQANIFMQEASVETDKTRYNKLLRKANRLDKSVAVFELASYYKQEQDFNHARILIENAWSDVPSIKLGKLYIELDNDVIPIHRFQQARKLSKYNKNHPISHILVATYAMESQLWGISFEYLNKFKKSYPVLAHMLLARLEHNKAGDTQKVWQNIEKAFAIVAKAENLDAHGII